jgi:hypothetical protein
MTDNLENVKLTPDERRILTIATQVYAFDPMPEDWIICDALCDRHLMELNSDIAYMITPAGRRALEGGAR